MVQNIMPTPASRRVAPELRAAIRTSRESIRTLAARHGLNPKTVAKWRGRTDGADRKPGPARTAPRALSARDEAVILGFRRYLPLSLDDSMAFLAPRLPGLSRSALHRLLQRHGLSRPPRDARSGLPDGASGAGCFHIDIVPVRTGEREQYLFFAIEQQSALIFGLLRPDATQATARDFLEVLADGSPAPVTHVLTSDRFQFTTPGNSLSGVPDVRDALEKGTLTRAHPFEYACAIRGIQHHLVPEHFPWGPDHAEVVARATAGIGTLASADETVARSSLHAELGRHNDSPRPSLGGVSPGTSLATTDSDTDRTMGYRDKMSHPKRRRDATREAILEAARNRIARDGPEGLSLSEVARLAGINRGTAYQHFRTRDRLIAETAQWMSEKLHRAVFTGRGIAASDRNLAALAGRLADAATDDPELCRAWLLHLLASPDPGRDPFWRDYDAAMARLAPKSGMDGDVMSVGLLAGALLWPVWLRTNARSALQDGAGARRFARQWLRIAGMERA
ncbi:MAG TPA: TetR family transcriptional regulator [Sphingobium sp.]|uniref:TetR family transcriptional regulator n=1 Tax=Sphingobium sp. TaxID=1912891 RepID=UPI002ED036E3